MEQAPQTTLTSTDPRAAEALSVRRLFTRPGVHPFESVEWERRTAAVGSFRQEDVEFPTTWSQNATNIVAQKYFRGQLSSPTRERSVKQMVSRVAGTIADWGRERGYFASVEDGDAFEAELTYILLHQMAAFNSPVWFNVGFEESPQCSACQPYDALVSTPEGMVPIGKLVEGEQIGREVYDADGVTRIVAVKHNGRKPVIRVRLRNGSFIEATPDHVVKAVSERRTVATWLRVDELRPGMRMHLHPHRAKVRSLLPVAAGGLGHMPLEMDGEGSVDPVAVAEAALAGWLQADGFVGQYEHGTNRSLTVEFQVATDDEYLWILDNLELALPNVDRHVRETTVQDEALELRRIRLYGEALRPFVDRWGLLARGVDIRVPTRLWTASQDEVSAYLRSIFQADGYVMVQGRSGRVSFAVISERWAEDVQLLLSMIGVYSRRILKRERRADRHDLHEVSIGYASERARFTELVGFIGAVKQRKLLASLTPADGKRCPDLREEEIVAIDEVGVQDVYDIQTESGEYLTNNIAVHNCFILSVEDTMESILDWNTKEGKIFRGGSGSGINLSKIRGSMEPLSKGGTASGPVSFMRGADAWAGTIKSGGKTRRAAKMVVLDVDHPDIREFIWCKAKEEDKAAALRDAGFDMSIDGDGFTSIQYQNANNSVRLTDEFMRAVENDEEWHLTSRVTGEPVGEPIPARQLMREIAEAAWRCADPGVQYDTTINQWHTCPNSGRINASNPCCFVGETLVGTEDGAVSFSDLYARFVRGEQLPDVEVYDLDEQAPARRSIASVWVAGATKQLVEIETVGGQRLRCTPEHRFLLVDGAWVAGERLTPGAHIRALSSEVGGHGVAERVLTATVDTVASVRPITLPDSVKVFDLEVEGLHNFTVRSSYGHGIVVHNSEYMHVDDSACNLASLNLMKFRRADGSLDVDRFNHVVDIVLLAQEIIVGPSSYPTEEIGANARRFRQLGLGYANLGAYVMANGHPYDSDAGRGTAAAITALMTGRAYLQSAKIASALGAYDEYAKNREAHNNVMRMHRDATYAIPDAATDDPSLLAAARETWNEAVALGELYGYRNAQASVLAPTGTISFLLDCDTTGIEPDFSLVKYKELVGGGHMVIVNRTVPMALKTLGYDAAEIEQIEAHINEHGTIVGAPGLAAEHLSVFDVAVGERAISPTGHIKMMAAVQPFLSGAISKTINVPQSATVEDIAEAYIEAWRLGVKALAIYRDGSKTAQALRTDAQDEASPSDGRYTEAELEAAVKVAVDEAVAIAVAETREAVKAEVRREIAKPGDPQRNRMPRERQSLTHKFSLGGHEGYITAGMYPDGTVGEIFLTDIGKEGSTLRGMMNSFATAISIALQYGVPLETLVRKFSYMRFEPEGITQNPEIPFAKSMPDYIMRWLASRFLDEEVQEELGILTPAVRARRMGEDVATGASGGSAGPGNEQRNGGSRPAGKAEPDAAAGGSGASGGGGAQLGELAEGTDARAVQPGEDPAATALPDSAAPGTTAPQPPSAAFTDTPPVVPARMIGLDLGPACAQCGGMMQRTGSCYTCSSCGSTTGCG